MDATGIGMGTKQFYKVKQDMEATTDFTSRRITGLNFLGYEAFNLRLYLIAHKSNECRTKGAQLERGPSPPWVVQRRVSLVDSKIENLLLRI